MLKHTLRRHLPHRLSISRLRIAQSHFSNFARAQYPAADVPPTTDASARLDRVAELLSTPKRLKYTSMDCFNLYQDGNSNLVGDMLQCPQHQTNTTIMTYFRKSKLVAAFVLDQLCTVVIEGKHEVAISFLKWLDGNGFLGRKAKQALGAIEVTNGKPDEISTRLASALILENLRMGEPLVAALCALKMHESNISIDTEALTSIIASLSVHTPHRLTYHSYTIVKLFETFKTTSFPLQVQIEAISSMLGGHVVPYFANTCYDQLVDSEGFVHYALRQLTRKVIEANLECENLQRCASLWKHAYLANAEFAHENLDLFARLIDLLALDSKETALQLAESCFPADLQKDPRVIDSFLSLYGQSSGQVSKFEVLTHELKPPLLRKTLSVLFASFLHQNNEKAAERILQVIFRTKNGLSAHDFQHIVQKLLRQQKIQQSVTMCKNSDVSVSKGGYVKTIEFFLSHSATSLRTNCDVEPSHYDKLKQDFLVHAARKLKILEPADPALMDLTVSIFKYLSHHIDNKASRKLYIVHSSSDGLEKPFFAFQSYKLPAQFNDLMYISKGNRLKCLVIILNQAVGEKDQATINWSISEMIAMGLLPKDTEVYYPHNE